jgi:hypothetical protein
VVRGRLPPCGCEAIGDPGRSGCARRRIVGHRTNWAARWSGIPRAPKSLQNGEGRRRGAPRVEGASLADQDRLRADGNAAVESFFVIRKRQGPEAKFRSQVGDGGDFAVELLTDRAAEQCCPRAASSRTLTLRSSSLSSRTKVATVTGLPPKAGQRPASGEPVKLHLSGSKTSFVRSAGRLCATDWPGAAGAVGSTAFGRPENAWKQTASAKRSRFVCPKVVNEMRLPVRGVEVLRTGGSQELFEGRTHESDRALRRSGNA